MSQGNKESEVKYYDGLLFRFHAHLGRGSLSGYNQNWPSWVPQPDPENDTVTSSLQRFGIEVGYAFSSSPDLIPYFGWHYTSTSYVPNPYDQVENYITTLYDTAYDGGIYYYFSQSWYFLFALQANFLGLLYTPDESGFKLVTDYQGNGIKIGLGNEWWVSENTSLGVGFIYRNADIAGSNFEEISIGKYEYYGLVFSLGYDFRL